MRGEGDISVFDRSERLVAVVLIKPEPIVPVRDLRRDITADAFVLVVSREWLYLWPPRADDEPPFVAATAEVLSEHLRRLNATLEHITATGLEMAVWIWLTDLAYGLSERPADIVTRSGFLTVLRGSRVHFENAA